MLAKLFSCLFNVKTFSGHYNSTDDVRLSEEFRNFPNEGRVTFRTNLPLAGSNSLIHVEPDFLWVSGYVKLTMIVFFFLWDHVTLPLVCRRGKEKMGLTPCKRRMRD